MKTSRLSSEYDPASDLASASAAPPRPQTGVHVYIVRNEFIPLNFNNADDSKTFGQVVDESIIEALDHNDQIKGFEVVITDEDWTKIRMQHHG